MNPVQQAEGTQAEYGRGEYGPVELGQRESGHTELEHTEFGRAEPGHVEHGQLEYGLKGSQSAICMLVGVSLVAAILPIGYMAFTSPGAGEQQGPNVVLLAPGAAMLLMGTYLLMVAVRSRLLIGETQIRVRSAWNERSYDLSEIEGYRMVNRRYGAVRVLCLKGGGTPIEISRFATDDRFRAWLQQQTDLDERYRQSLLKEISQNQELGSTPEERLAAVGSAKTRSIVFSVIAGVAGAALLFAPAGWRLPSAAVLWLSPVAVFVLLHQSPLLYTIFRRRGDPRGDLSPVLAIAGFSLLWANRNMNLTGWSPLWGWMLPVALVFVAAFYGPTRHNVQAPNGVIALLALAVLYSCGAVVTVDTLADTSRARTYPVHVTDKYVHVSSGRGRSTSYYLVTDPWGPDEAPIQSVQVTGRLYRQTRLGDLICMGLHPGLLHAGWYEPVSCGDAGGAQ